MARTKQTARSSNRHGGNDDDAIILTGQRNLADGELASTLENDEIESKGTICDKIDLYQKKDEEGNWIWTDEYPQNLSDPVENSETAKYALLVRNIKCLDGKKKLQIQSIQVQSPLLRKALGMILVDYPGVTTSLEKLTFTPPFAPFVHRWLKLVEILDSMEEGEMKDHLTLLYEMLKEELKETISAKLDLVANGVIDFGYMWTIFEPGSLVYGTSNGYERIYQLNSYQQGCDNGVPYLQLRCWCVDWDGDKFGSRNEYLINYSFPGTTKITRLPYYPVNFHPDKAKLETRLLQRGRIFESFKGFHYMAYKGIALGYGRCGMVSQNLVLFLVNAF